MADVPQEKRIVVRDVDGRHRVIDLEKYLGDLTSAGFKIVGLTVPEISELKALYLRCGGAEPITVKSIKALQQP